MSHLHFCDAAGHEWQCEGKASRPLAGDTEPSVCMCMMHGVPMEDGDHSECPIELLACPEHMDEQLRQMGYEPGTGNMPRREEDAESSAACAAIVVEDAGGAEQGNYDTEPEAQEMSNTNDWSSVEPHIERHEGGCWTWDGSPLDGNVYRFVAEAYGAPRANEHGKLYRMPNCTVGKPCVNPNHIGTIEDYMLTLDGRRQDLPEPSKTGTGIKLTAKDRQFLKSLNIVWS